LPHWRRGSLRISFLVLVMTRLQVKRLLAHEVGTRDLDNLQMY
jgi:hypothetical protein